MAYSGKPAISCHVYVTGIVKDDTFTLKQFPLPVPSLVVAQGDAAFLIDYPVPGEGIFDRIRVEDSCYLPGCTTIPGHGGNIAIGADPALGDCENCLKNFLGKRRGCHAQMK